MKRYLTSTLEQFSKEKFVLLAGPRQVGKTTLALGWLEKLSGEYLNWDDSTDRERILRRQFLLGRVPKALLLDEIHKYPRWKSYLKGLYDKERGRFQVTVTGSARLDLYRKGGDSLFGRYELLRLHPFSIGELRHGRVPEPPRNWLELDEFGDDDRLWRKLSHFGGFPEPFTKADPRQHQRWSVKRRELLIRQDLRDLAAIKLIELVEHLYLLLPERVGSPLSLNAMKEEIGTAYNSIAAWLTALEQLYICYRLAPFHKRINRSLRKERKLYLWDWSQVPDEAARFENMVAGHLLKSVHAWTDLGYGEFDLLYWRNKEKQEVDFVVCERTRPVALIECKLTDETPAKSLTGLSSALGGVPAIQLVQKPGVDFRTGNTRVVTAGRYLSNLA